MPSTATTNVVPPLDQLVGRSAELELVRGLLVSARLITLVGPAGAGKTRLSEAIALDSEVLATFAEVWFCDLTHARTTADIVDQLAEHWGLELPGADSERQTSFREAAGEKPRSLVILDNFETVVDDAALAVHDWAARTHHTFLVTSTRPLDVRGEQRVVVGPLAPDDAVELFVRRGYRDAGRQLPGDEAAVAARIVDRLDHLPLAIELAARQVEFLSAGELEAQLDHALDLLDDAPRDSPERHRSLRAMVEWGWSGLSVEEQQLMQVAALFEGGFTPALLAEVAGKDVREVRKVLKGLQQRSMIARGVGSERLALLQTLRTFARTQLADAADETERVSAYVRAFGRLAAAWLPNRNRRDFDRTAFDGERANLVAALRHALDVQLDGRDFDAAVQIALAIQVVHERQGAIADAPLLMEQIRAAGLLRDDVDRGELATLGAGLAEVLRRHGDPAGDELMQRAVDEALELDAPRAIAATHLVLASALFVRGEPERGLEAYRTAVEAASRAEDPRLELDARQSYVVAKSFLGEFDIVAHEELYALAARVGDAWMEAACLTNLAISLRFEGRLAEAIPRFETARAQFDELGDETNAAQVSIFLGVAHVYAEQFDEAVVALERAREVLHARGGPEVRHIADIVLAEIALARGERVAAERVLSTILQELDPGAAPETETLVRLLRFYLACCDRDEAAVRAEAARMPDPDGVRSFDVRLRARALLAAVADLDASGTPSLDALIAEVENNQATRAAHAFVFRGVRPLILSWRPGADKERARDELAAELRTLERLLGAVKPGRVAPLRRWVQLFRDELGDSASVVIRIAPGFSALRLPDGEWIDLKRKGRKRAILRALIEQHAERPGTEVPAEELFALGWPDTKIRHESALARVYTAMSELRKMGFDEIIDRTDVGYLVRPNVVVEIDDA